MHRTPRPALARRRRRRRAARRPAARSSSPALPAPSGAAPAAGTGGADRDRPGGLDGQDLQRPAARAEAAGRPSRSSTRRTPATRSRPCQQLPRRRRHRHRRRDHRHGRGRPVPDRGRRPGGDRADRRRSPPSGTPPARPRPRSTRSTPRTDAPWPPSCRRPSQPLTALANLPNPAAELGSNPELDRPRPAGPQCRQIDGRRPTDRTRRVSRRYQIERVFYRASRAAAVAVLRRCPPAAGRRPGRACSAARASSPGSEPATRPGCRSCWPTPDRAAALRRGLRGGRGHAATPVRTESGATALRTAFRCDLVELARAWTRGAVKAVPPGWQLDGAALRMWALAAGRPDERGGYLLALDPHAPQTHLPLIAAATRARHPAGPGRPRPGPADQRHRVGSRGWSSWSDRPRRGSPRRTGRATGAMSRRIARHLDGLVTLARHRSGPEVTSVAPRDAWGGCGASDECANVRFGYARRLRHAYSRRVRLARPAVSRSRTAVTARRS